MRTLQIFFLVIFSSFYSQKIEYEISFCGRDQKVIIVNKNNKTYKGWIESKFFKKDSEKKIIKTEKIPKIVALKLFNKLKNNGINLPIEDDKKCGDFYLDGDYLSFEVRKDGQKINKKLIAEVYPESESKIEQNQCRRESQILATLIDNELNLKKRYSTLFKKLPKKICYWSGYSMVCKKE